jgi:hypothetical protein
MMAKNGMIKGLIFLVDFVYTELDPSVSVLKFIRQLAQLA